MPTGFTQQNQRFRPSSKEDQVVQKAREHFERTLIQIRGELAAVSYTHLTLPTNTTV
mgnify:CR=1 FL=1